MAHPIVGLWKTTVAFEDKEFKTVHNYLPDGQVIIDAGIFVTTGVWEATGERSTHMLSVRPIVTGTLMDRAFHGWQEVSAEATVNEDDILVSVTEFDAVDEDGMPRKGTVSTRGERVTLGWMAHPLVASRHLVCDRKGVSCPRSCSPMSSTNRWLRCSPS